MLNYDWDLISFAVLKLENFSLSFILGNVKEEPNLVNKVHDCVVEGEKVVFPLRFQAGTLLCWRAQLPSPQSFRSQYLVSTVRCIQKLKKTTCMLLVFTCDLMRLLRFEKPYLWQKTTV